jgi:uncharacterized membrane protein
MTQTQLSPEDLEILHNLRHKKRHERLHYDSIGANVSDWITNLVGSWRFIIVQSCLMGIWLVLNITAWIQAWDPYPFILLNLVLSFQAAYTAPIIMMSQNRQNYADRKKAQKDYDINLKAELEIELLHQKIDAMKEKEILSLQKMIQQLLDQKK